MFEPTKNISTHINKNDVLRCHALNFPVSWFHRLHIKSNILNPKCISGCSSRSLDITPRTRYPRKIRYLLTSMFVETCYPIKKQKKSQSIILCGLCIRSMHCPNFVGKSCSLYNDQWSFRNKELLTMTMELKAIKPPMEQFFAWCYYYYY